MANKNYYGKTESPRVIRTKGIPKPENQPKKKRKLGIWKAIIVVLLVVIVGVAGVGGYLIWDIGKVLENNSLEVTEEELGIDTEDTLFEEGENGSIVNVALFGVDQRGEEACRSDAIMVLSVDKKHGKIKVVSLLRDSLVTIEGRGYDKLGHAYFYGGPELAIKTINQNLGLNIKEYVTVNFNELAQIVDAVGGVTITVKEKECYYLNKNLREQAKYDDFTAKDYYIEQAGEYHLNGQQALAYARIRKSDSDFVRSDRQRTVLRKMFDEALSMSPLKYPEFAKKFLTICDTSLDMNDCLEMVGIMAQVPSFVDVRLPLEEDLISGNYYVGNLSYVYYDMQATSSKLRDFIYNDVIPEEANTGNEETDQASLETTE